jgi:hypothetical protein
MAISPEQAQLGVGGWELSPAEVARLDEIEREFDAILARSMSMGSTGSGLSLPKGPGKDMTEAMKAELVRRYRSAGWDVVIVREVPSNYSIHVEIRSAHPAHPLSPQPGVVPRVDT